MDGTKALFKKIRGRDRNSFDALSENYGWKLYSYIRKNTPDRETADRIFSESIQRFYATVDNFDGDDPIEAMLCACADQVRSGTEVEGQDLGKWAIGHEAGFSLPKVDPSSLTEKKEPLALRIFYGICILILVVGILAALWVMAWMLMSMNLIPELDLGYSWFNQNVMNIFQ